MKRGILKFRKLIICIVLSIVLVVPAVFINTLYGYIPIFVMELMILFSFVYLQILKKTISYKEMSDLSNCQRGTEISFTVEIKNASFLVYTKVEPFFYISDLFGRDDTVTSSIVSLSPFEKRQFDFDIRFDHIGTYNAGLRKIVLHDLLGLFSYTIENEKAHTISVVPRLFVPKTVELSNEVVSESEKNIVPTLSDSADYNSVREYVIGDPIKNIHWKLSARQDVYMTKLFENYTNTGMGIIMDFMSLEYDSDTMMSMFDGVVETAISLSKYAVDNGIDTELMYLDKKNVKKKISAYARDNVVSMVEDMPKIHIEQDKTTAVDILREEGNAIYSQGNIAFCTDNITADLIETMINIKNRRKNPMLFILVPDSLSEEEKDDYLRPLRSLSSSNISYSVLESAEDLQGGKK